MQIFGTSCSRLSISQHKWFKSYSKNVQKNKNDCICLCFWSTFDSWNFFILFVVNVPVFSNFIKKKIQICKRINFTLNTEWLSTLQMFCLQNTQMFVCVLNSRTNIGCFHMYLSVMENKYFHVAFIFHQKLNLLKNWYILSNLQKFFVISLEFFHNDKNFSVFFLQSYLIFISTSICQGFQQH